MTFEQVKEIVAKINNLYMEKGFVTARAFVPEQTIEDGTIYIDLLEGKVGEVTVTGNRWTKESYIKNVFLPNLISYLILLNWNRMY